MRYYIALFFFLSVSGSSAASVFNSDSMDAVLQRMPVDTAKVKFYQGLCNGEDDLNKGLTYGELSLNLAAAIKWQAGIASSYLIISRTLHKKEDFSKALLYAFKALECFEKLRDTSNIIETYYDIGHNYDYLGDCPPTLEYYSRGLDLSEKINDEKHFVQGCNFVSETYFYYLRDYKKVEEICHKALQIANRICDMESVAYIHFNLCLVFINQRKFENAKVMNQKAMDYYKSRNDYLSIAQCHFNNGNIYRMEGLPKNALEADMEAKKALQRAAYNKYEHGVNELNFGDDYLLLAPSQAGQKKKEYVELARNNYQNAVRLLTSIKSKYDLVNAYKGLAAAESQLGYPLKANAALQNYIDLKDEVFSQENSNKLAYLEKQKNDELMRKEKAIHHIQMASVLKESVSQKRMRNLSFFAAGLIGLALLLVYRQRNRIQKEKKISENLLLNILPPEVAEELKSKGSADAKLFNDVTIMFTDFKGFTHISETLTPAELVAEIHTCFKAFDNIISRHNIEKIKTIGDSYMCAGGLPVVNTTNACDVVSAALEIQEFMVKHLAQRKMEGKELFEIRIGVHTGPVVAGIVGVKKFAYDIWGDAVNIASRMESSGEVGKVNISATTYALVKEKFKCIHRGKIVAKGKGEIDMYFVDAA